MNLEPRSKMRKMSMAAIATVFVGGYILFSESDATQNLNGLGGFDKTPLVSSTFSTHVAPTLRAPQIHIDVVNQIRLLVPNYASFGDRPGRITIGSYQPIIFSAMSNAVEKKIPKKGYPDFSPLGPLETNVEALVQTGDTAYGSYGAGASRPWCVVVHHGLWYKKTISLNGSLLSQEPMSQKKISCVAGK